MLNHTDRTINEIVDAIRLDADMRSVGMRMVAIANPNWCELVLDMPDDEAQSLGIHGDNEVARFIMLLRVYDKHISENAK